MLLPVVLKSASELMQYEYAVYDVHHAAGSDAAQPFLAAQPCLRPLHGPVYQHARPTVLLRQQPQRPMVGKGAPLPGVWQDGFGDPGGQLHLAFMALMAILPCVQISAMGIQVHRPAARQACHRSAT